MFNLAVAIVAMSSAISLTSCDKFFGGNNDANDKGATITDSLGTDTTGVKEAPEATASDAEATEADKAEDKAAATPEADKADADKTPAPDADKASTTPAEKK